MLLNPSRIKRWYLWDLQPDRSVVAGCVAAGLRVFLAEWTDPGPDDQDRGLDAYADSLLTACLDLITEQTGADRAVLVGHSLGALRAPGHGIAGSMLNAATATAAPVEFQVERHLDLTRSLARPGALATHLRVQRWTLDECAMPGQLFEDIIERIDSLPERLECFHGPLGEVEENALPVRHRPERKPP